MEQREIYGSLPHRYPMLFIDDIYEVRYGEYVKGVKCISRNEPWAQGHFPNEAVFPGVLTIESMAQICGFMFYKKTDDNLNLKAYISKIDEMKFLRQVVPGDQLIVEGEFLEKFSRFVKVKCKATVNGKVVAKGVLTYYFDSDFEVAVNE